MRLNKYISETGMCSRREADRLIAERQVTVNGKIAELGTQVEDGDAVRVGKRLISGSGQAPARRPKKVYIALNKPVGITCTTEAHIKGNIVDFVGHAERIFPIGRLDKESEGLILLTNNGDIVNDILRAENNHEKEYLVSVDKAISDAFLIGMANGVRIDNVTTKLCKICRLFAAQKYSEQVISSVPQLVAPQSAHCITRRCRPALCTTRRDDCAAIRPAR
jgi:23S rRNA pseudouridine2604 synthase